MNIMAHISLAGLLEAFLVFCLGAVTTPVILLIYNARNNLSGFVLFH